MDLIIREGTIVTSSDIYKADIGIKDGKITIISDNLLEPAREEINAEGKYVFPGFIDGHTHLEMPLNNKVTSVDDFYTGTVAAAFGGTTSIVDYIVPSDNQTLIDATRAWKRKAQDKAVIDYGFHITVTNPTESTISEVKNLYKEGITSVKCFTTYLNKFMMSDEQIYKLLKESKESKMLVIMHCENGYLLEYLTKELLEQGKIDPKYHPISRPPILEEESISKVIDIAKLAEAPILIAHLSTSGGLQRIKTARNLALPVFAETCPAYLILTDEVFKAKGFEAAKYVCSPPIRPYGHQDELWRGIFSGDIQVISTDHCPFNYETDKQSDKKDFTRIPNGIPSIEERIPLLFSEGVIKRNLNLNKFVAITSSLPAKIFGLYPEKGNLNINSDADIVIYNPHKEWIISHKTQHHACDYNVFEGMKVTGKPELVISNGEVTIRDDEFIGKKGRGKFIKRNASTLLG
ncbi:MAG: dihydropyrimidinase [Vampirovibrionia bacterium]